MRPRVRGEEFVAAAEALAEISAQAVIARSAIGEVGVHVAEGDAVTEGAWIAVGIELGRGEIGNGVRYTGRKGCNHGGVQAGGTEEVRQRGRDIVGQSTGEQPCERACAARGDEKGVGRGRGSPRRYRSHPILCNKSALD